MEQKHHNRYVQYNRNSKVETSLSTFIEALEMVRYCMIDHFKFLTFGCDPHHNTINILIIAYTQSKSFAYHFQ